MTAHRGEFDAPFSRPSRKKPGMESSMLEYSQHMRRLNDSKSGAYKYEPHARTSKPRVERHSPPPQLPPPPPPHSSRDVPNDRRNQLQYPRHRRPLSFDENDLQRNQKLKQLKQRPYRDTKSERPPVKVPVKVPNGLPPLLDPPGLHKHSSSSSPDLDVVHKHKQLRLNLVNAADLYDLVDLRLKDAHHETTVKVANPEEGLRFMEELHWARTHRKPNQLEPLPHHHHNKFPVKPECTVPSSDDPNLLVGKSIKSEYVNPKSNRAPKDTPKHDDVYFLDKDYDEGRLLYRKTPDTTNLQPDSERVLDVFLEQAAAKYRSSRTLKSRPKRAKRMQLRKPDLLSIPEDGGSFIRPSNENSRQEMLSSSNVPYPSSTSLSAIKEVNPRATKDTSPRNKLQDTRVHESSFRPPETNDTYRKSHSEYKRYGHYNDDLGHKKSPRSQKYPEEVESRSTRGKVDLDSVIMTSIYSGLAIDPEGEQSSKMKHVTLEKTSPKERAQRKMKRLIFLRDQPEQNYRREF